MSLLKQTRGAVRRMLLGDTDLPQQCTVPLLEPQDEIGVWLDGAGAPRDVTSMHVPACAAPFMVGIPLDEDPGRSVPLSLRFIERQGERRLLGEIGLRTSGSVSAGGRLLRLFEARSCRNYCLPRARMWAHYLHQGYVHWRRGGDPDVRMTFLGAHSMTVFFICPRPVALVSVVHGERGNIFPMNLMGPIGDGWMAFSLNSSRQAAPLVEQAGRVVLSSVPYSKIDVARQLGRNHRQQSVRWDQLPFETTLSAELRIPVPRFALRVRELQIEAVRKLGSHTLFIARVIRDQVRAEVPEFFMVHGTYEARRRALQELWNRRS